MMSFLKTVILTVLIAAGLAGAFFYNRRNNRLPVPVSGSGKPDLAGLNNGVAPENLTIYVQNAKNDFPKTKIDIPKESGYLIAIYKDRHKLELLKNNLLVKEYDVNIRRELADRKTWEDSQTPEGIFYIETMDVISDPPWSRWMRLDTIQKAKTIYKEAYGDGRALISEFEAKYGKIDSDEKLRQFNGINPGQKILRGIGIHGGGFSLYHDWTWGCIALSDENVIELFGILEKSPNKGIGTKVIIQD